MRSPSFATPSAAQLSYGRIETDATVTGWRPAAAASTNRFAAMAGRVCHRERGGQQDPQHGQHEKVDKHADDERNASTQNHPVTGTPMNAMTPAVFRALRNICASTWGRFPAV